LPITLPFVTVTHAEPFQYCTSKSRMPSPVAGVFRSGWAAVVQLLSVPPPFQVRVVCAVDCGMVVNPDTVEAQVEGAVVYGLSAALRNEITVKDGAVVQGNFDDFEPLRIDEMPAVEVFILPSGEAPGGIGEPGLPPIAPAVVNAIAALTGKRLRRLPLGTLS